MKTRRAFTFLSAFSALIYFEREEKKEARKKPGGDLLLLEISQNPPRAIWSTSQRSPAAVASKSTIKDVYVGNLTVPSNWHQIGTPMDRGFELSELLLDWTKLFWTSLLSLSRLYHISIKFRYDCANRPLTSLLAIAGVAGGCWLIFSKGAAGGEGAYDAI